MAVTQLSMGTRAFKDPISREISTRISRDNYRKSVFRKIFKEIT